jgi:multidrug efflux system outer membrane protein
MSITFRLAVVVMAMASGSCTMIPGYHRPVAPVGATYPFGNVAQHEAHPADIAWRDFFLDERLKELLELAMTSNRDLRVAILNVAQSHAQYRITASASYPTIDANGSYIRSQSPSAAFAQRAGANSPATLTSSEWNASLGTTAYEVDLWGRVRSLNQQALEMYLATDEARRSAQIALVAEVATAFFTLRENEEALDLSRQTLQAVQLAYDLNKALFDAGASSDLDFSEAAGQVQTAKINVLTYERQEAQADNNLVLLIGRPLPTDLPLPRPFAAGNLLVQIPVGLPSELLERRPDILKAEHTLKAANADIGAARAAFFPAVVFTASIGSSESQFSQLFGLGTGIWSFSPQITLPIFTGGRNVATLEAAKVGKQIEIANYEKAIQTAFREVSDAMVGVRTYSRQIDEEAALIAAQKRRYELAIARFRHGDDTYLNALTAQQDLYSAQQGLIQAQFNSLSSQISLYQALGGGWK